LKADLVEGVTSTRIAAVIQINACLIVKAAVPRLAAICDCACSASVKEGHDRGAARAPVCASADCAGVEVRIGIARAITIRIPAIVDGFIERESIRIRGLAIRDALLDG